MINSTLNKPPGFRILGKTDCDKCGARCVGVNGRTPGGIEAYYVGRKGEKLCTHCAKKDFLI